MSQIAVPPPISTFCWNWECSRDGLRHEQELTGEPVNFNSVGFPYRQVGNCRYPAFMRSSVVKRLRAEWICRANDVFLVFPAPPINDGLVACCVALIEQCNLNSVDLAFPRWVDAAVSRRGWEYMQAVDSSTARRCFTTHSPPWLFPCANSGIDHEGAEIGSKRGHGDSDSASSTDACGPRIVVFVADPRYLVMKEMQTLRTMTPIAPDLGFNKTFESILPAEFLSSDDTQTDHNRGCLPGFCGGAVFTSAAWAEAEAQDPDRIRLFFIDDFLTNPEVALDSLVRFLHVPELSHATSQIVKESARLCKISHLAHVKANRKLLSELLDMGTFNHTIVNFEQLLMEAPHALLLAWERTLGRWLHAPNPRMVAWASGALQHGRWNPQWWWASHSAQVCRPCLFFPRGKCADENCGFCHGPGHHKPKRPPRSVRKNRRAYDRTPSPDLWR